MHYQTSLCIFNVDKVDMFPHLLREQQLSRQTVCAGNGFAKSQNVNLSVMKLHELHQTVFIFFFLKACSKLNYIHIVHCIYCTVPNTLQYIFLPRQHIYLQPCVTALLLVSIAFIRLAPVIHCNFHPIRGTFCLLIVTLHYLNVCFLYYLYASLQCVTKSGNSEGDRCAYRNAAQWPHRYVVHETKSLSFSLLCAQKTICICRGLYSFERPWKTTLTAQTEF